MGHKPMFNPIGGNVQPSSILFCQAGHLKPPTLIEETNGIADVVNSQGEYYAGNISDLRMEDVHTDYNNRIPAENIYN
jgi:hypothetical protein